MTRGPGPVEPLQAASEEGAADERRSFLQGPWRWSEALTWFMRVVAIVWILKGLSAWSIILGAWSPAGAFEARSTGYQATIIYFAAIDLIAAVGLWMASTWGGVMWLLAVMSHLILAVFFPRIVTSSVFTSLFFVILIGAYLAVSWLSAQEE